MHCSDFIFDNERLSGHGYMMCNFDGADTSWNGGDVTFKTVKPPSSNVFTHYCSSFEEPISFNLSIMKNPCDNSSQEEMSFAQDEESYIMRWLQRLDGYHWFAFDQEGWEDVWFNIQINPKPHYINGDIVGYDLTCVADSPYGYSRLYTKKISLSHSSTNNSNSVNIKNYSDIPGYFHPKVKITPHGNGNVYLLSGCDDYKKITRIENAIKNNAIILDKNNDEIEGINNINNFNFVFPVMANSYKDINTVFTNIGDVDIDMEIEYRFIRRVAV